MAPPSSFDQLFEASEEDLFWGLITRIEGRSWSMDQVSELPPQSAALVRLAFFSTRYDNGRLLYVFECDRPGFGRAIVDALRLVSLDQAADLLAQAFDLFPTKQDYDDWDKRFRTIAKVRPEFDRLDDALCAFSDSIRWAAGRYIKTHRRDFEYLRAHRPYDSSTDTYGGDESDAR